MRRPGQESGAESTDSLPGALGRVLVDGNAPTFEGCMRLADVRQGDTQRLIAERGAVLRDMVGDPAQASILRALDQDIDLAELDVSVYLSLAHRAARVGR